MVTLWGRPWTRGVRMLRCWSGAGFDFEILVDRGCDIGGAWLGGADDATVFNYPHRVTETYGLHGRYTGLPARLTGYGASWDGDGCLPRHITWRQLGTVAYVVAMEPSTNRDAGRFDARDRGELVRLAPGEVRRYRLETGALDGRDAIDEFTGRARAGARLAGTPS